MPDPPELAVATVHVLIRINKGTDMSGAARCSRSILVAIHQSPNRTVHGITASLSR